VTEDLQEAIERLVRKAPPSELKKGREDLSKIYLEGQGSKRIFESLAGTFSYLAARMPATFGAVEAVLKTLPIELRSWIDLGAGPGTASWAASFLFPEATKAILVEKSPQAIRIGKELAANHPLLKEAEWISASLPIELPDVDAAILSYALGELDQPSNTIDCWWKSNIPFLIVVEPGTPRGFTSIRKTRDQILSLGGFLIAPCPHGLPCPMQGKDWCHFSVRISRSRLHRYVKEGSLGYEDEKYSYLIASKEPLALKKHSRILRHPQKQSGHVRLTLCKSDGATDEAIVSRSHPLYRQARDASWGDIWVEASKDFV
jgi:ribosomal protein RSM22 (predicted rRNA methylase)